MIITTTPSVEGYRIVEYKGITYGEVVSGVYKLVKNQNKFYLQKGDKIMIITTTPSVEGYRIVEYKGITYGEVVSGVNFFKDFAAGLSNIFGGRSNSYEDELKNAREKALEELEGRAAAKGANAVVGVDTDYEVLGADNGIRIRR